MLIIMRTGLMVWIWEGNRHVFEDIRNQKSSSISYVPVLSEGLTITLSYSNYLTQNLTHTSFTYHKYTKQAIKPANSSAERDE